MIDVSVLRFLKVSLEGYWGDVCLVSNEATLEGKQYRDVDILLLDVNRKDALIAFLSESLLALGYSLEKVIHNEYSIQLYFVSDLGGLVHIDLMPELSVRGVPILKKADVKIDWSEGVPFLKKDQFLLYKFARELVLKGRCDRSVCSFVAHDSGDSVGAAILAWAKLKGALDGSNMYVPKKVALMYMLSKAYRLYGAFSVIQNVCAHYWMVGRRVLSPPGFAIKAQKFNKEMVFTFDGVEKYSENKLTFIDALRLYKELYRNKLIIVSEETDITLIGKYLIRLD